MKLSKDVLQKIKHIEIQTRRLLSGSLIGDYSSAQKGSGMEFDQIREYQQGDDIRFIDWNATARSGKLLVKQYIEERNRNVMLLVDNSGSTMFGSTNHLKSEIIAQVASVLALVADCGKDHVGALLFSEEVNKMFAPKQGRQHIHHLMEHFFAHQGEGKTSLQNALKRLIDVQKQKSIVFIISDFLDDGYEKLLKIVARQHEVIAVRCNDPREIILPEFGFLPVQDPETGEQSILKTSRSDISKFLQKHHKDTEDLLRRCGVETMNISFNKPFVGDIIRFFKRRMMY
jgi:uncharacterized protein (DUF58 family)